MVQVQAVCDALRSLGHEPQSLPCTLNLDELRRDMEATKPDCVFNLVESLEGHGNLLPVVPALLDALRIPYAGCGTDALFLTSNKLLAKRTMHGAGLPTPSWVELSGGKVKTFGTLDGDRPLIVKSVWEHASIGIDENELVRGAGEDQIARMLLERALVMGGACFGEAFVNGREFNLSLLAGPDGPKVLPPAEIDFSDFPAEKLRIVGYKAKWDEDSFEYHHTPRRFDFPASDGPLLKELSRLALECWRLFDLHGWARVDFRVDERGRPWILEVNANPCIAPDAGFAAAVERAGLASKDAIRRILDEVQISDKPPRFLAGTTVL